MSTTKVEYGALIDGAKEATYLSKLLNKIQLLEVGTSLKCFDDQILQDLSHTTVPTMLDAHLFYDNTSVIKLAHNLVFHTRSKHIELHHHYICEQVLQGELTINYLHRDKQPADILTKAL